jgi:hypothetical protein
MAFWRRTTIPSPSQYFRMRKLVKLESKSVITGLKTSQRGDFLSLCTCIGTVLSKNSGRFGIRDKNWWRMRCWILEPLSSCRSMPTVFYPMDLVRISPSRIYFWICTITINVGCRIHSRYQSSGCRCGDGASLSMSADAVRFQLPIASNNL